MRMAPEHKFETAARLSKEVVGGFCEGGALSLQEAPEVLRDALCILASPHIKVCIPEEMLHLKLTAADICMKG